MSSIRAGSTRSADTAWIVIASFAVAFFLSKLPGLELGYALDDFATRGADSAGLWQGFVAQGRFTFAALHAVISTAGLQQPDFAPVGFGLSALAFAWFFLIVMREMRISSPAFAIALGALLGSDPFFSEYVSFRQSMLPMAACLALTACSLTLYVHWLEERKPWMALLGVAVGATAAGLNQLSVALLCIAILTIELARLSSSPSPRDVGSALVRTAAAGAAVTLAYVLLAVTAVALLDVPVASDQRAGLVPLSDLPARFSSVLGLATTIGGGNHSLHPGIAIALLWIAAGVLAVPTGCARTRLRWVTVSLVFFVVASGLAVLPAAAAAAWWPMPRVLIAVPIVATFTIVILSRDAKPWQTGIAAALMLASALLLAGKSSSVLYDQQRLNRWDMALAQSVLAAVDERHGPAERLPLVLHNTRWAHPLEPTMPNGDLNLSAVSVDWAVDALFEEATGRRVDVRIAPPGMARCAEGQSRFPSRDAMFEADGAVNVCM